MGGVRGGKARWGTMNSTTQSRLEAARGSRWPAGRCVCSRLSVRAYTQLLDDHQNAGASPLFTDTYLSLPVVTEAGKRVLSESLPW